MTRKIKRRRYLLNYRFQIKWTIIISLVGTFSAGLFAIALWYSIDGHNALLEESIQADENLKTESQDLMVLLVNMPDRTEKERQRYVKRFDEIDGQCEATKKTKERLIAGNRRLRYYVLASVALIGICLFVWGIFLTHKVAGPLFVIKSQMEKLVTDGKIAARPLRKGDEFQDYYEAILIILERLSGEDTGVESEQPDE